MSGCYHVFRACRNRSGGNSQIEIRDHMEEDKQMQESVQNHK